MGNIYLWRVSIGCRTPSIEGCRSSSGRGIHQDAAGNLQYLGHRYRREWDRDTGLELCQVVPGETGDRIGLELRSPGNSLACTAKQKRDAAT